MLFFVFFDFDMSSDRSDVFFIICIFVNVLICFFFFVR